MFRPANINQKLSAIRKLASESEDNNLLDSRIANGIRAVRGMPVRGRRTGNWLTREEAQIWLNAPDIQNVEGRARPRNFYRFLIGCGLRRAEASILSIPHIQQREGRWAIVDIVGKRDKNAKPFRCLRGRGRRLRRGHFRRILTKGLFFGA